MSLATVVNPKDNFHQIKTRNSHLTQQMQLPHHQGPLKRGCHQTSISTPKSLAFSFQRAGNLLLLPAYRSLPLRLRIKCIFHPWRTVSVTYIHVSLSWPCPSPPSSLRKSLLNLGLLKGTKVVTVSVWRVHPIILINTKINSIETHSTYGFIGGSQNSSCDFTQTADIVWNT